MFDGAIFYTLCFILGKFFVWLFTLGKSTTSLVNSDLLHEGVQKGQIADSSCFAMKR